MLFFPFNYFFLQHRFQPKHGQHSPRHKVTLPEAHIGDLVNDTRLLDSYEILPANIRQFYLDARAVFSEIRDVDFTNPRILESAQKHNIPLMGGPMLGNLKEDGIIIMLRPSTSTPLEVKVTRTNGGDERIFITDLMDPGVEQRIVIDGLTPDTDYHYTISTGQQKIAKGKFKTAPDPDEKSQFRLAFGSCFHKIGLHNPNLANQIIKREPHAMALIGDIAVDDRENNISMHRSDYLLRDVSAPWQKIAANIPLYSAWDDHDYLNNDLRGIPARFNKADREALRAVWRQNWNNPVNEGEGIYFNTRIGPVELIMLDTRSCSTVEKRGEYGSYLGMNSKSG
jgi:alkaline phosphatase D